MRITSNALLALAQPPTENTVGGRNVGPIAALSAVHDCLPERVVVKLVPQALVTAEKQVQLHTGFHHHCVPTETVACGPIRAIGFPAWPIIIDPDNAQHALNLVADLEWARRTAASTPGKVQDRFAELTASLERSVPHFVPALLEELARIFDDNGKSHLAARFFGRARASERTYNIHIDPNRQRVLFQEFAERGVVTAKELTAERTRCIDSWDSTDNAFEYFLQLNVDRIRAGGVPYTNLPRDLAAVGKMYGLKPADTGMRLMHEIKGAGSLRRAPLGFIQALAYQLARTRSTHPELIVHLFSVYNPFVDVDEWLRIGEKAGLFDVLDNNIQLCHFWVNSIVHAIGDNGIHSELFTAFLLKKSASLRGLHLTIYPHALSLEIIDALLGAGVEVEFLDANNECTHSSQMHDRRFWNRPLVIFANEARQKLIPGHCSIVTLSSHQDLVAQIIANTSLKDISCERIGVLIQHGGLGFVAALVTREMVIAKRYGYLLPHLSTLISSFFRALDALKNILTTPSSSQKSSSYYTSDTLSQFFHCMSRCAQLTAADIAASNIRNGLLTELAWPELERHVLAWNSIMTEDSTDPVPRVQIRESFPGAVAVFGKEVVAVEGDNTIGKATIPAQRHRLISAFYFLNSHSIKSHSTRTKHKESPSLGVITAHNQNELLAAWSDDSAAIVCPTSTSRWGWHWDLPKSMVSVPLGTEQSSRLCGNGVISPHQESFDLPDGVVFCDASGNMWRGSYSADRTFVVRRVAPVTAVDIQQEIPPQLVSAQRRVTQLVERDVAKRGALNSDGNVRVRVNYRMSTLLPAPTAGPEYELSGSHERAIPVVDGEVLVASVDVVDRYDAIDSHAVTTGDGGVWWSAEPCVGVAHVAGLTWLIADDVRDKDIHTQLLIPAASRAEAQESITADISYGRLALTLDARGNRHWMHDIPWSVWGNLRLRDAAASQRLRHATAQQLEPLTNIVEAAAQETKKQSTVHKATSTSVSPLCRPNAPAMEAAATFLGTDDQELCASVVQLVKLSCREARRCASLNTQVQALIAKLDSAPTTAIYAQHADDSDHSSTTATTLADASIVAAEEVSQLAAGLNDRSPRKVQQTNQAKPKQWEWLGAIGLEKALISWATGPFAHPRAPIELAAMLQGLSELGVGSEQWSAATIQWFRLTDQCGKFAVGTRLPTSLPVLTLGLPLRRTAAHTHNWTAHGSQHRILCQASSTELPESVLGVPVEGAPTGAATYGVSTALSSPQLSAWSSRICELYGKNSGDPATWYEQVKPCVQALCGACALTEAAAIVLFGGGIQPIHLGRDLFDTDYVAQKNAVAEDALRVKSMYSALGLSQAAVARGVAQLNRIDAQTQELLLAAAFDSDVEAIKRIAADLPQSSVPIDDALLAAVDTCCRDAVTTVALAWKLMVPLPKESTLNNMHGLATAVLLHLLIDAHPNNPHGEFYVAQLRRLAEYPIGVAHMENVTELPLQGVIPASPPHSIHSGDAFRALKEGLFDAVITDASSSNTMNGCVWDPRVSATMVVDAVVDTLRLSTQAATYFLQLLCLVNCTDAKVKTWNGWTKKELDAARTELLQRELVVEGKRARSGRRVFLSGAWLDMAAPNLPMEEWKAPYYLVRWVRESGKAESVVSGCPPLLPPADLFSNAWERYAGGEVPSLEQIKSTKYRKKSC